MSYIQISVFLIISLSIVFSVHYFVYFSIVRLFSISGYLFRTILLALVFLLPLSFVLSMLIVRSREDIFSRAFYFLSGFWMGLVVYLLMASLAAWTLFLISKMFGFSFSMSFPAAFLFLFAVCFSFYGAYNAFHVRVKSISVDIAGLPPNWKGEKAVQISDAHVGNILTEKFIKEIIEKINSIDPKAVFLTGDFFDSADGNLEPLAKMLNGINANNIFFVTGNHETYLGIDRVLSALEKTKVKVLRDEIVDIDGVKIIGVDFPSREMSKDVTGWLESEKDKFYGQPSILLYHSPVNAEAIGKEGVSLQLSGHTHKGQLFPFGYITRMIYGKYHYGLHKIGDNYAYTSSGVGVWGPTMRTGSFSEIVSISFE